MLAVADPGLRAQLERFRSGQELQIRSITLPAPISG
jgi:hypothetical protein